MVAVRINGAEWGSDTKSLSKLADLLELVKASIDPEHMITGLLIDGREADDIDWTKGLCSYETSVIEIETGTPQSFVQARMEIAPKLVRQIFMEFRDARKRFQDAKMQEANKFLHEAVTALKAFFTWYSSLLDLMSEEMRKRYDITVHVQEISKICNDICQQQLYQSWWALGESIEKRLEPKLDQLEDCLRKANS